MLNIGFVIVCHCHGISDRRIESEMRLGARTVEDIGERCGAGTNCGGCVPLIEDILESKLVALLGDSAPAVQPELVEPELVEAAVRLPVRVRSMASTASL